METLPLEEIVELAFAIRNGEPLTRSQLQAMQDLSSSSQDSRLLNDFIQILSGVKRIERAPVQDYFDEELLLGLLDGQLEPHQRRLALSLLATNKRARKLLAELYDCFSQAGVLDSPTSAPCYVLALLEKGLRLIFKPLEGVSVLASAPVPVLGKPDAEAAGTLEWTQDLTRGKVHFRLKRLQNTNNIDLALRFEEKGSSIRKHQVSLFRDNLLLQSSSVQGADSLTFSGVAPESLRLDIESAPGNVESLYFDFAHPAT